MRYTILALTVALCLALVSSNPLPENGLHSETLDRLVMAETDNEAALRSKRTIGILRTLFPDISQRIEAIVNTLVAEVIRVLGPTLLRGVLGGAGGGGGNSPGVQRTNSGTVVMGTSPFDDEDEDEADSNANTSSRISISLPTFPDDDDAAEQKEELRSSSSSSVTESGGGNIDAITTTTTTTIASLIENEVTASL